LFRVTTALILLVQDYTVIRYFWERINEDDEKNILTIREDKKDKYFGLRSDPPYFLRILNAEMSDRGYYTVCDTIQ
jgi:hypothetical protein